MSPELAPQCRRMRVARLYAWGDVRVEEAPVPQAGPGELLLRVDACGVCGSDALMWYVDQKASQSPVVLGHEPVGTVVAVGAGVGSPQPGERIFVHHHAPCLVCEHCRRGVWSACATWKSRALDPGGFAQFARVSAAAVARDVLALPPGLSNEVATFIEPLACCLRAVRRYGRVHPGDAVLIIGLGAMGLLMAQLARLQGATRVLGSEPLAERRDRALASGADAAFDPGPEGCAEQTRRLTGGRGADVVMVCPGSTSAILDGLGAAAPGGRVVCFTPLDPDQPLRLPQSDLYFREVTLSHSYSCGPVETRQALGLLESGDVLVDGLVTHRGGLEEVAVALQRAAGKGGGLKTVIWPGGSGVWG
jgi:L-iditol 2-dehydrogenase